MREGAVGEARARAEGIVLKGVVGEKYAPLRI
mgnify:CR=1 FL=1|jgi:hypothetical protein